MPQPTSFALSEANQRRLNMVAPGLLERVRAHVHLPETTVTWSSAVCRQLQAKGQHDLAQTFADATHQVMHLIREEIKEKLTRR